MPIPAALLDSARADVTAATLAPRMRASDGPIVVATDGGVDADAAVRLAWQLAGRTNADVQVLTALQPFAPVDVQFSAMPPPSAELRLAERDAQLAAVRAQLCRAAPAGCAWPVAIEEGATVDAIARGALDARASLLVLGRGRHGALGRLAFGEVVLDLMRHGRTPLYAVSPGADRPARRVIVAMDFSPFGMHAARVALRLVAPDAIVMLAHVRPHGTAFGDGDDAALRARLDRAHAELAAPDELQLESVVLADEAPGRALADFAAAWNADLVVSATHGHGLVGRLVLGSVARDLLRGAPCSLLCVPGATLTHAIADDSAVERALRDSVPSTRWDDFTRRLADRLHDRPCALTRAETGRDTQRCGGTLAYDAIDYSPDTGALRVRVRTPGDASRPETQLVEHVVEHVESVDRLVDATDADVGLDVRGDGRRLVIRFL